MTGIVQTGAITPGHLATWATDGVVQDGGPVRSSKNVLATLLSADFTSIADQALLLPSTMTAIEITGIVVTNAPVSLTVAAGGFYPQTSKGGTAIVAAGQVYSSLNAITKLLLCTISASALATRYSRTNLPDWAVYLSLTTAQSPSAAVADIYLLGVDLTV